MNRSEHAMFPFAHQFPACRQKFFFSLALFHYQYVIKLVDLIHSGVEMVGPKKREMSGIILNYFYSGILASNDIR